MAVKPIPDGYHTVTPYLTVDNAEALLTFIKQAFNGTEMHVMRSPDGRIGHADLMVGDSHIMMGQAGGNWPPVTSQMYLYVADCDAWFRQAVAAGGTPVQEPKTEFYGDRHGCVKDPCGNLWWMATHVEDVTPEEIDRRAAAQRATP
jgi:uncharacterized glyoxalase superfamily protein PhnB